MGVMRFMYFACSINRHTMRSRLVLTCVTMPHFQPTLVSPVNWGRQSLDKRCEMCYGLQRWKGAPFNKACHVIEVVVSCAVKS